MEELQRRDRQMLIPIWKGTTVYCESVFVLEDVFGQIRPLRLAYPIKRIAEVRSADLTVTYREGKDYGVNEYGELEILRGGNIPYLSWKEYRYAVFDPENDENIASADALGAYHSCDLFCDREGMRAWQLAVTYEHEESKLYDVTPIKSEKFGRFLGLLKDGKPITAVSYGDSITYGWGASGMKDVRKPPFCKPYNLAFLDELELRFSARIRHINRSVSGMGIDWAEKEENLTGVIKENPDLVILAFGMNDAGTVRPCVFRDGLLSVISKIRAVCPETEFLLISPILPNPLAAFSAGSSIFHYHAEYPRAYAEAETRLQGVAAADVTAVHKLLLERKAIQDTLSNNVNHPNDFMHRIYAQVALKTVLGE